jgi:hypothetical protein
VQRQYSGTAGRVGREPDGLITLTVNELRRLFDALLLGAHRTLARLLHWSTWRRRHQHRARRCHYQRHQPQ